MMAQLNTAAEVSGASPHASWKVEVFYDGLCPICHREIEMLRRMDARHDRSIRFTDISIPTFQSEIAGLTHEQLMARIHGRLPDGTLITGPEVLRRLYEAVGHKNLVRLSRMFPVSWILEISYIVFARIRPFLPRRNCGEQCRAS